MKRLLTAVNKSLNGKVRCLMFAIYEFILPMYTIEDGVCLAEACAINITEP